MRDRKIDVLRFLGLSLIILAHSHPPAWLFEIRNFDLPLMVILSGLSYVISFKNEPYPDYLWKRVKRLLFPAWIFLTVYFACEFIVSARFRAALPVDSMLSSYGLMAGIGYVWIIRVFLLVTIFAPLLMRLNRGIASNGRYLLLLAVLYAGYELVLSATFAYSGEGALNVLGNIAYYGAAYSLVFALGMRLPRLNGAQKAAIVIVALAAWAGLGIYYGLINRHFVSTQEMKYPPSAYYLSYGIAISLMLWSVAADLVKRLEHFPRLEAVVAFISQNTLWIYLWQILAIRVADPLYNNQASFAVIYLIIYAAPALITFIQVSAVKKIILPRVRNITVQKNLALILMG